MIKFKVWGGQRERLKEKEKRDSEMDREKESKKDSKIKWEREYWTIALHFITCIRLA